jgi:hypothetical protein
MRVYANGKGRTISRFENEFCERRVVGVCLVNYFNIQALGTLNPSKDSKIKCLPVKKPQHKTSQEMSIPAWT